MKYVSVAQSRAGWQPEDDETPEPVKKAKAKPNAAHTPATSAEQSVANTNPDGGEPATNPEEGSA